MKILFRFRLNPFSRLNVVRSRTLTWTQTETKTAFPSSSNAQTLKPRLQTTQVLIPNLFQNHSNSTCAGSWIIEEDYAAQPAGGPLLWITICHIHTLSKSFIFSPIFPHLRILPNIPPFYSIIVNCWTIQQVHFWLIKTPNPITYLTTIWENKMLIFLCMVYLFRRW